MVHKIKTGIKSIDMLIGGLSIGTVNLVVGNDYSGKTTLLSKIAIKVVNKDKYHTVIFNSQKSEVVDFSQVKLNRATNIIHTKYNILDGIKKLTEIKNVSPVLVIFDDLTELDFSDLKEFAINNGCVVLISTVSPMHIELCDTILFTSIEQDKINVKVSVHSCPLVNDSLIEHVI